MCKVSNTRMLALTNQLGETRTLWSKKHPRDAVIHALQHSTNL
jgi:hypothetical protein